MSESPLQIWIEELALHGVDPAAGQAVADGLSAELAAALTGWRPGNREHTPDVVDAGAVAIRPGTACGGLGRALGARVAGAVCENTAAPQTGPGASR